jgi:pimeloyl-ACP methyl ester carboxylesterase
MTDRNGPNSAAMLTPDDAGRGQAPGTAAPPDTTAPPGTAAAAGPRAAPDRGASPIPAWPGEPVALPVGEVFVRTAPARHDAEPALFVHGLGGSAANWTDLMDLLRRPDALGQGTPGLASDAIDLPGFGFSPPPPDGDYSLAARAKAIIELIERRGNWPVHLIGNSMGGAISTRIAARRPELVRSLTLVSPALPDLRPRLLPARLALVSTPGVGRLVMERMRQLPPERRTDMSISDLYADPSRMQPERRAEAIAELIRRDDLGYATEVLLNSGRALVAEYVRRGPGSLWWDAARVSAPTLVIHGSHDRLVNPSTAGRAARTFKWSRVVVLSGVGHVAMMERPDLVAAEMREFLATAEAVAPGNRARAAHADR